MSHLDLSGNDNKKHHQQNVRCMATTGKRAGKNPDNDLERTVRVPKHVKPEDILGSLPPGAAYPSDQVPDESLDEREARLMLERWKPGSNLRKRPKIISKKGPEEFFQEYEDAEFIWRPHLHKRCGAIGIKLGMMPVWDDWGIRHPCTVLWLDHNIVLQVKSSDSKDGYDSVQVGAGEYKRKNVKKPVMGQLKSLGLKTTDYDVTEHPPYITREFRITPVKGQTVAPEPGDIIHARHFVPGQCVDVAGISKGKGFQGTYTLKV
jgi:hypothetical protein